MSSKCSRVVRSSSQGEIGLLNHVQPIESPGAFFERKRPDHSIALKTVKERTQPPVSPQKQQTRCCIFTIGSPVNDAPPEYKKPAEGFGEFLNACSLCRKKLKDDIYMYGYLGAFCSPECRECKMDLDGFEQEMKKEMAARLQAAGKLFTNDVRKLGFHR